MNGLLRRLCLLAMASALFACDREESTQIETISYMIDADRITVSGVSSGGYMAGQLHLAHSALFGGAGLIAAGPYYCAAGELGRGLDVCAKGGDAGIENLLSYARENAAAGRLDALENLSDDRVWLFHGTADELVGRDIVNGAETFYAALMPKESIHYVKDVDVVHGVPTLSTGAACDTFATPYLNACDYDAAGEILKTLYGELEARSIASGELRAIPQPGYDDAEMLEHAFLYVPASCADGASCGIHVALHGCSQSAEFVGDAFAAGAGFNEWAESNRLLILYPQVASSKIAPLNPLGCWDWWGYTDEHYATREGLQIKVIKDTLDALAGRTL